MLLQKTGKGEEHRHTRFFEFFWSLTVGSFHDNDTNMHVFALHNKMIYIIK